ncbi:hypothetical protein FHL15_005899 [Xylaria flabelliformis]|uniref:Uncharacterized protein n=1 Tax=Xylaria flabelliformis TaxID=2512241 RepID=A0A553HZD7_9PEZI|nr:hypothetical protein FHL15_005899 [Xylaria flabelliformis]
MSKRHASDLSAASQSTLTRAHRHFLYSEFDVMIDRFVLFVYYQSTADSAPPTLIILGEVAIGGIRDIWHIYTLLKSLRLLADWAEDGFRRYIDDIVVPNAIRIFVGSDTISVGSDGQSEIRRRRRRRPTTIGDLEALFRAYPGAADRRHTDPSWSCRSGGRALCAWLAGASRTGSWSDSWSRSFRSASYSVKSILRPIITSACLLALCRMCASPPNGEEGEVGVRCDDNDDATTVVRFEGAPFDGRPSVCADLARELIFVFNVLGIEGKGKAFDCLKPTRDY